MRVAAVYDLHGHAPALESVLADVAAAGADVLVVGGDTVPGPLPAETLALLDAAPLPVRMLRGNGEREVAGAPSAAEGGDDLRARQAAFCARVLGPERVRRLARLPATVGLDVDGLGPVLFAHGSPRSDEDIVTAATPAARLRPLLAGVRERTVVVGHTHVQFGPRHVRGERAGEGWDVVNAGSVGMPYEDEPGARWLLLGPDVELRRTTYDVEAAAAALRRGGMPGVERGIVAHLREPAGAAEATAYFERLATEGAAAADV